ncbi:cytochrome c-type biogenesis protein [Roseovarius aestuarii]|uniref:Cytochrome c-type biogenesis protein n=1 Tax=Roseovarius aestuarii TaxID=475083 RepID=A0A1X7BQ93_9RHOB|nr:cytochrome c-type biogenesis protein [Roseovarius aestuarii]SMC11750.1 Cytochrome c-type biogenesis protein CcmH precursor [Roseovarius aestuarii]
MRWLILCLCLYTLPALAVEPDEMLADPVLEARAQVLDEKIRCVKCRSEVIASSNADWASDARVVVRELIADGKTDDEVLDFFVARYGEYVLMTPQTSGSNVLLWLAGPLMLMVGGWLAVIYLRRRAGADPDTELVLSEAEQARLDEIMKQ